MKTNTNTELREKITNVFDAHYSDRPVNGHWLLYEDVLSPLTALIDQYVHEREVLARIDELEDFIATLVVIYDGKLARSVSTAKIRARLAELQASLNTEGVDNE